MSKLSDFLTNIANAIRNLKGTTEPINAQNFANEINSMKEALDDTTATPEDIKLGKTAFVKGQKVEGTYKTPTTLKTLLSLTKSSESLFQKCGVNIVDFTGAFQADDFSEVENCNSTFYGLNQLKVVPPINIGKSKTATGMFYRCTALTDMEILDMSNVETAMNMFYECYSYNKAISLNTHKLNKANNMFYNCQAESISLDMSNINIASNATNMFYYTRNLKEIYLKNIKIDLQVGSGSSWGHLLTLKSLLGLCQECINIGSSRTLTVGTANMNKLANVYVKLTGEPEEDETLPKIPMVQCESTDEGAMTIAQYMAEKNWSLA